MTSNKKISLEEEQLSFYSGRRCNSTDKDENRERINVINSSSLYKSSGISGSISGTKDFSLKSSYSIQTIHMHATYYSGKYKALNQLSWKVILKKLFYILMHRDAIKQRQDAAFHLKNHVLSILLISATINLCWSAESDVILHAIQKAILGLDRNSVNRLPFAVGTIDSDGDINKTIGAVLQMWRNSVLSVLSMTRNKGRRVKL